MRGFGQNIDPNEDPPPGDLGDVIRSSSEGARTRTVAELEAAIRQAGGRLIVNPNDSNYIVAVNNGLRFSVTRLANGQYAVTQSDFLTLLLLGLLGVGALIIISR